MLEGQTNIFEMLYPTYKITKKIRTIELFGGYGSQLLSLKYINADVEQWKLCEWAVKSIQAYKDIHFEEDIKDYSKDLEIGQIKEFLFNKGISSNYNEPMSMAQINRLNEKQTRTIYNNIQATHNLVNIQQVKGKDLEIVDTDKYDYILTYSFPCQDISGAGLRKGFEDTSTRSGMLWEVERILSECKELGTLPSVLLMENVPLIHSIGDNMNSFQKWINRLEELGYKNYWQDLIATDYGIPQTRNRTFMVSILGDYNYTFPKPIPLKLKLKDMLEDNVDEKYYLSDKMKKYIFSEDDKYKVNKNNLKLNRDIACSKTTREGWTRANTSDYITDEIINTYDEYNHKINSNETIGTIQAMYPVPNHGHRLIIKNATKKGYLEATDGDGIDLSQPNSETRRGRVQKEAIQTLTTQNNLGVCVIGNYMPSGHEASRIIDNKGIAPTIKENHGTVNATQTSDLRIRKLTPKECFRLMGVKDEDFDKVAKNQSDSSLYHLAGDSLITTIMMALFSQMLDISWQEHFNSKEWWNNE